MGILKLTRLIALISLLVAGLALPALATASGDDVIRDCAQDGDLDKEYSDKELEEAEENMPSDIDAYSSCRDVIRAAQSGGRGGNASGGSDSGGGGIGGSGGDGGANRGDVSGSDGATPSDREELDSRAAGARGDTPPTADDALPAGANAGEDSGLPTAALVAIALLGLAAVGGGVYLLREYLPPGLSSRLPGASR